MTGRNTGKTVTQEGVGSDLLPLSISQGWWREEERELILGVH